MSFLGFLYSQWLARLPYPTASYAGKTIIVTGSNVGLGKEAARHFTRLGASSVILAVRSIDKGNAAKEDIESTTGVSEAIIKVWQLDMASYDSVKEFATRVQQLPRVDIFLANAGVAKGEWTLTEGTETQIAINVISTFLLSLLVLPKLKETATRFNTRPTLSITSSGAHAHTTFPQKFASEGKIFDTLNDEKQVEPNERYPISKLLEIYPVREIAARHPAATFPVTINCINPGLCKSELAREAGWQLAIMKFLFARSTEVGSRTLVHACTQGAETHGGYLSDCRLDEPGPVVTDQDGRKVQPRVWDELARKLETISPGCTSSL
ncbi:short-chain dehydrogenase [Lophiostoma macrostomum CBS 122681]|uniref:Short-chain dehydrogenase n=1 Tax=Lophiostoma macrostomum CBS 122681 TaxID=1314788 RepID=A0A6A6TSJ8_9PLEO|nr:short-chain dehydrogenase [Lophiostoma macrostomum CBS 122681]